mgnify:FL=1
MSNNRYGNLLDKVMNKDTKIDTSILETIDKLNSSFDAAKLAEQKRREEIVRNREQRKNEEAQRIRGHEETIKNMLKKKEQQKAENEKRRIAKEKEEECYKTLESYIEMDNPELAEAYAKMLAKL